MNANILDNWTKTLSQTSYYANHFVVQDKSLAEKFIASLYLGQIETISILPHLIDYKENSHLTSRELLDSFFKLRDIALTELTIRNKGALDKFLSNLEEIIIKMSTYFSYVRLDMDNSLANKPYVTPGPMEESFLSLDKDFKILKVNSTLLNKFEYTRQEIIGKPINNLFTPSSQNIINFARDQLSRNLRLLMEVEVEAISKSGKKFRAILKIRRQRIGEVSAGYNCVIKDVTYIHETKSILNLMSMAMESVGEGIVIFEPLPEGKILYVNHAMEQISGYPRHQLLGKSFSIFSGQFFDRMQFEQILESSKEGGWQGEITSQRKDGTTYPVFVNTQPVKDENGDIIAIVAIQRDVTEQKQNQQEILNLKSFIENIVNNLHQIIIVTDQKFRIQFWNHTGESVFQFSKKQAYDKKITDLIPELSTTLSPKLIMNNLKQKNYFTQKIQIRDTKNLPRYHQLTVHNFRQTSSPPYLLWVLLDIHEEELMKQKITWQNARLKFLENLASFLNSSTELELILKTFSNEFSQIFPMLTLELMFSLDIDPDYFQIYYSFNRFRHSFPKNTIFHSQEIPVNLNELSKSKFFIRRIENSGENSSRSKYQRRLAHSDVNEFIILPLVSSKKIIGLITIGIGDESQFQPEDLDFLSQVVGHLTIAIKNSFHFQQLATQNKKLNIIQNFILALRSQKNLKLVLQSLLRDLHYLFPYQVLAIYKSEDSKTLELIATFEEKPSPDRKLPSHISIHSEELPVLSTAMYKLGDSTEIEFFKKYFPGITFRSALLLKENTTSFGNIILVGFSKKIQIFIPYHFHLQILSEILKEISITIDQQALFERSIRAEQEWKATFDAVKIGLALVGKDGQIQQANQTFWEIFPHTPSRNSGVRFEDLIHLHHFQKLEELESVSENNSSPSSYHWYAPETNKYFIQFFYPLGKNGKEANNGILTIQDVTEVRNQEEKILFLSRFPETNPNLILNITPKGKIFYYNPSVRKLLHELQYTEDDIYEFIPPDLIRRLREKSIPPQKSLEFRHQIKNRIFQFVVYQPSESENFYLYGTEITDQLKLQEQLIQTERMRAMGEMAAGVAHDFNNLLATILGRTQLLNLKSGNPLITRELKVIEKAARDGGQIVKKLQEATRTHREKSFEPLSLAELLNDSLMFSMQKLKPKAQIKGQQTKIVTDIDENITVYGNPIELKEVFTNLLFNAFDAMPDGGTLSIKTRLIDNKTAEIIIKDTGIGIPPEIINKIFEPFFTTKGERGTGLGLSVVYNIITSHKGTIQVKSKVNAGTEFIISLPTTNRKTKTQKPEKKLSVSKKISEFKLLVVDDEAELLDTMSEILKLKFKQVDIARSGEEAIQKLNGNKYDVVLSDLGMPEVSGWQVARKAKETNPSTRTILITGWGMQAEEEQKNHPYVDAIISKPYELNQLVETINKITKKKSRKRKKAKI